MGLFPINSAVEPVNQLGCPYSEGVAYAKEGRERDGSASLYLLPVASGKAKSNHVFLGESSGFAKLFYSLPESAKKLFLIDQACFLSDLQLHHHEQISCVSMPELIVWMPRGNQSSVIKGTRESVNQFGQWFVESNGDSKKSLHRNRSSFFNLLPVSRRESKGNHVFLRIVSPFPQGTNPLAQSFEEFACV